MANTENGPYTNSAGIAGRYAEPVDVGETNSAYAVPRDTDAPYTDTFGWGPSPRIAVNGTPDAMRLGDVPSRTVRPNANSAPEEFYRPLDADDAKRHSAEEIDADGWTEKKDSYKIGPDPRWNPPGETRVTEQMAPRSYSFVRPFDQGSKGNGARQLNGMHFSMADHRRDYEILGMQPWAPRRNTFRVDPAPWDTDMYDVPPESDNGTLTQARIQSYEIPGNGDRSYRLG